MLLNPTFQQMRILQNSCKILACLHTNRAQYCAVPTEAKLPSHSRVVIAGAGMIGNSVAYHLVQKGWSDILIIDKGNVADGTSKDASGMLGLFRPKQERNIVKYCIDLYQSLQKQGHDIGLVQCGSLNLAQTKDRLISLKRRAARYVPTGLQCQVMTPNELRELHPYLFADDLHGGVWVPEDATVNPKAVSEVFAKLAHEGGAKFVGNCGVKRILTSGQNASKMHNNHVYGVETELGSVTCEYFVNCAGIWVRELANMSNPPVKIPVCPADHFFLTYNSIPGVQNTKLLPSIRDYDNFIYLRHWNDSFMLGAFEPKARSYDGSRDSRIIEQEHWQHFSPFISAACKRLPILRDATLKKLVNTPDAFTPDSHWILGETPEIKNYFVCAGMNGNSLQGAGGVGKAVADWIISDKPEGSLLPFEIQRFTNLHNNKRYLFERTMEVVGRHYLLEYPMVSEFKFGRGIRSSPIYSEFEARGAVFGEKMGFERALYFDQNHHREDPPSELPPGSWGKPSFFEHIEDEYSACREGVGLLDMSSFAKFIIKGEKDKVVNYLQKLCSNEVNIPIGGIVQTGMQNKEGGYENDCILIRREENVFFMVSPTTQQTRIKEWMEKHLHNDNSIAIQDVTSMYTILNVIGPKSKDLMEEMSDTNMGIPIFTYKEVNVGYASGVMALALTNTGEPGYSLYIPSEFALHVYDSFMRVGRDYGIRNVGYFAMRFLRIEKFIPFWGEELNSETTPIEMNRTFKVKFDKESFIGKEALLAQRERGVEQKLVQLHLEEFNHDTDLWPWGGEPIYRNGRYIGATSSTAYGFTLHKMVALGIVKHPDTFKGQPTILTNQFFTEKNVKWEIDLAGKRVPVSIHQHPPKMKIITLDDEDKSVYKPQQNYMKNVQLLKKVQKAKIKNV